MNQEDGWGGGLIVAALTLNTAGHVGKDTTLTRDDREPYPYFNIHQATNPEDLVILTPKAARHFAESATNGQQEGILDDQPESEEPLRRAQSSLWPECLGEPELQC